jgi:hypothetical protein
VGRTLLPALATLAVCAGGWGSAALAAEPPHPDSTRQPLRDGCQRNPAALLVVGAGGGDISPEWVYVNRDNSVRVAEGVAHATGPATEDLPFAHSWYDIDSNVDLDQPYRYLLGGDPEKKTGNFVPGSEETNRLHIEWESGDGARGTVPPYAWPTEGDRVKVWGQWIWDCGHWGQDFQDPDYFLPGTGETPFSTEVPGEGTELHPLRALVVTRAAPDRPSLRQTQTDVFISSDGTIARAEEECARRNPALSYASYPFSYTACVNARVGGRQQVEDRDYTFFVPAPPRLRGAARLRWRAVDVVGGTAPVERVRVGRRGIHVTIPFKGFGDGTSPVRYGKTFYVRWSPDARPRPAALRVTLHKLTVFKSLDPNPTNAPRLDGPPGEYGVYLDINGWWKYLNEWAPGLDHVSDGEVFTLERSHTIHVPRGEGVRVYVFTRECDLPRIYPCPSIAEGAPGNDRPGNEVVRFPSVASALGDHVIRSRTGAYELALGITRVR